MELIVLATGIKQHLKKWEDDLLCNALAVPKYQNGKKKIIGKGANGEDIYEFTQIAVRPMTLYRIGFPKEELNNVLANTGLTDYIYNEPHHHPHLKKYVNWVRKLLKLKPVPKPKKVNPALNILYYKGPVSLPVDRVTIIPINDRFRLFLRKVRNPWKKILSQDLSRFCILLQNTINGSTP